MNMDRPVNISGQITILEMNLIDKANKLELTCKISFDSRVFTLMFHNVSRIRFEDFSSPIEILGFEILDHSKNAWESDSKYEICDYEDDKINFFCEEYFCDMN